MSHLWTHKRGERYSAVGGSDIFGLTPITPQQTVTATGVVSAVIAPTSSTQELLGAVYQDSKANQGTAVYFNSSSAFRFILNATVATAGTPVGVVGSTNSIVHPLSGTAAVLPLMGPVAGSSGVVVWQIGTAEEIGIPGQPIRVRINPRQLSGLA